MKVSRWDLVGARHLGPPCIGVAVVDFIFELLFLLLLLLVSPAALAATRSEDHPKGLFGGRCLLFGVVGNELRACHRLARLACSLGDHHKRRLRVLVEPVGVLVIGSVGAWALNKGSDHGLLREDEQRPHGEEGTALHCVLRRFVNEELVEVTASIVCMPDRGRPGLLPLSKREPPDLKSISSRDKRIRSIALPCKAIRSLVVFVKNIDQVERRIIPNRGSHLGGGDRLLEHEERVDVLLEPIAREVTRDMGHGGGHTKPRQRRMSRRLVEWRWRPTKGELLAGRDASPRQTGEPRVRVNRVEPWLRADVEQLHPLVDVDPGRHEVGLHMLLGDFLFPRAGGAEVHPECTRRHPAEGAQRVQEITARHEGVDVPVQWLPVTGRAHL